MDRGRGGDGATPHTSVIMSGFTGVGTAALTLQPITRATDDRVTTVFFTPRT
jgi:hypothetical protein